MKELRLIENETLDENTNAEIRLNGLEFRITEEPDGNFTCRVYRDGSQFGAANGGFSYEQVSAWLRLFIGYHDSYKRAE